MSLDDEGDPAELLHLRIGDRETRAFGGIHLDESRAAVDVLPVRVAHGDRLLTDAALEDRGAPGTQTRLVDVELVGVDGALHDRLAEAVGARDEHRVIEARLGVEGEHHARGPDVGAHHALHSGREGDVVVVEAVVHAVGDRLSDDNASVVSAIDSVVVTTDL